MKEVQLTNAQARRFMLRLHGLVGEHVFEGKQGVLDFVRQCGCIQFDPIDVCGKNPELVLQSRVAGFRKSMLNELLYTDRVLVDYFDKQLAIIPVEDWPYFAQERAKHSTFGRSREVAEEAADAVRAAFAEREFLCARDLGMDEKVDWYWSASTLSRVVLETLYFRGELGVHHKQGTIKHYAPTARLFPGVHHLPDPHADDVDAYREWQTLRRIGAVGLLWNRGSDAFLCVDEHKNGGRAKSFERLIADDMLIRVQVEGIDEPLYASRRDEALLDEVASGTEYAPRMELIAPLDNLMWDRKLIAKLFGFAYSWEIYTPADKRQYGYYVLPLLRGESFVGRVEAVADRKAKVLNVKGVWWEGKKYQGELRKCLKRFARFNDCKEIAGL